MKKIFFKRDIPKEDVGKKHTLLLVVLFFISLLLFAIARFIPLRIEKAVRAEMESASRIMAEAEAALRECRIEKGLTVDKNADPEETGLIGMEFSPITTSLGSLEAKRMSTNPDFAALVVLLLHKAGVKKQDTIAVGASSSFPALVVATLSAAKAMDLRPLIICSLGASQWGANNPAFHWLDMQDCLKKAGIFDREPVALSLGGEKDTGEDMSPEGRAFLSKEIEKSGIYFLYEPDLIKNVESRMQLYEEKARGEKIKAFVNIGGSWSNMGEDSEVLRLKPGLTEITRFPPEERRGVLYAMAERKIPVIHLLSIKGLVQRWGQVFKLQSSSKKRNSLYPRISYFLTI